MRHQHKSTSTIGNPSIIHSTTRRRGQSGRRIVRNPDDGSYTCLEMENGRWQARRFGATEEEAGDFIRNKS